MTAVAVAKHAGARATGTSAGRYAGPLLVVGFLVLQLAWLLATPPFGGSDEVDHVYRAQGVARGDVLAPPTSAAYGTGAMVSVPRDIVDAAGPQCRALPYTSAVNCEVPAGVTGDVVTMPSSAGRYHPLYYALVGGPSLPFDGLGAMYAMRITSILLCTGLFAIAVWCLGRTARGRLPYLALLVATTPVVLYSTTIVAPNGWELSAAIALWCALLGLSGSESRPHRGVVLAAVVAACVLATSRGLGPLWLGLVAAAVLALRPPREAFQMVRSWLRSRSAVAACSVVSLATLGGVAWTLSADALDVAHDGVGGVSLGSRLGAVGLIPLWILQSMAAFPHRSEPAPPVVYLCLLALAWRHAARPARRVMAGIAILGVGIPFAITAVTVSTYGDAWQGRYTLPFTMGLPLVAGYVLDRTDRVWPRRAFIAAAAMVVVAQAVSLDSYLGRQLATSPYSGDPAWVTAPTWAVTGLALVGAVLMAAAVAGRTPDPAPQRPGR